MLTVFSACCVLAQDRSAAELVFGLAFLMLAKVRLFLCAKVMVKKCLGTFSVSSFIVCNLL